MNDARHVMGILLMGMGQLIPGIEGISFMHPYGAPLDVPRPLGAALRWFQFVGCGGRGGGRKYPRLAKCKKGEGYERSPHARG